MDETTFETVDESIDEQRDDPDAIDCDVCGDPIGHDEHLWTLLSGYNCHGSTMGFGDDDRAVSLTACVECVGVDPREVSDDGT